MSDGRSYYRVAALASAFAMFPVTVGAIVLPLPNGVEGTIGRNTVI